MSTTRQRLNVKMRDVQTGDLIQRLNADLTVGYEAITKIERVRPNKATRYRMVTESGNVHWLSPNAVIEVLR